MKILHVLVSPHLGGAERMGVLLTEAQRQAGHDLMIHLMAAGDVQPFIEERGLPFVLRGIDPSQPKRQRWRQGAEGIAATAREFQPDIVHSHVSLSHLLCHRVLPKQRVPWVATLHGSWRAFGYSPDAGNHFLRSTWAKIRHIVGDHYATLSASRTIAVSKHTEADFRQIGISKRKLRTIINGFRNVVPDISREAARERYQVTADALAIGAIGHFAPVKGFDLLVEGFAEVANDYPHAMVLIAGGDVIGNTKLREMLQKRITELNLTDRVRMVGAVDIRQGFLQAMDIFALPSRMEGIPAVLVEAMQHGLPSLISSAGGSHEAARPDRESLMFRTEDTRDLVAKLKVLLENPGLRDQLGRTARERALSALSLERCNREYVELYEEVVAEKHS